MICLVVILWEGEVGMLVPLWTLLDPEAQKAKVVTALAAGAAEVAPAADAGAQKAQINNNTANIKHYKIIYIYIKS